MTFSEAKALFESQQLPLCETHYRQFQIYLETLVETNQIGRASCRERV